jgi:ssDNA-binding Zn-finger/Zn-ribbon topoisomerase 1
VTTQTFPCPDCGTGTLRVKDGKWGPFYGCSNFPTCHATHDAHQDGSPVGIPADAATRALRKQFHVLFDEVVAADGDDDKDAVYRWLAQELRLTETGVHAGVMDAATATRAIRRLERELQEIQNEQRRTDNAKASVA